MRKAFNGLCEQLLVPLMVESLNAPRPVVSIIILNHNGFSQNREAFLKAINSALEADMPSKVKEVILVDNGSSDGGLEYVKAHFSGRLKIVSLNSNLGHAAGMNAGVRACSENSAYLVLANNDVLYGVNTISSLVDYLDNNQDVAVCGCLEVFPWRRVNFCGSYFDLELFNVAPRCGSEPFPITTVENLIVVRREVFVELRGFDEGLLNVFDEQEFCLRVWMSGRRVVCHPEVSFVHNHVLPIKETPARWALDLKNKYITILKLYSMRGVMSQLGPRIVKDLYKSLADKKWRENDMFIRIVRVLIELFLSPSYFKTRTVFSIVRKYNEIDLCRLGIIKR